MNDRDLLESAFETLKARSTERVSPNLNLEERLMSIQEQQGQRRMPRVASVLTVLAMCIVGTGMAEATTGIVSSLIRSVQVDTGGRLQSD